MVKLSVLLFALAGSVYAAQHAHPAEGYTHEQRPCIPEDGAMLYNWPLPPDASMPAPQGAAPDCYDYLTELVRSSNFPFGGTDPCRVNLLIDTDTDSTVFVRLIPAHDTELFVGGWVKYSVRTGEIFDCSAQLEHAQRLRYDRKWAALFQDCRKGSQADDVRSSSPAVPVRGDVGGASIRAAVEASSLQPLPMAYNYDYVTKAPGFAAVNDAQLHSLTARKDLSDGRLRRLPKRGAVQPVLVQGVEGSGESPMYLVALDARLRPVARLVLYEFEEGDGYGVSTTFIIDTDFTVTTTQQKRTDLGKVAGQQVKVFRWLVGGKFVQTK